MMCAPSAPAPVTQPSAAPSSASLAKAALPGVKANEAAKAGGGIAPAFLANLVSQQSGSPGSGLEILNDIKSSLGQ